MLFNSVEFLIFFIVVTAVFFVVPKIARNYVLLVASYVFYAWWNVLLSLVLIFVTLVSYFSAIMMENVPEKKKLFLVLSFIAIIGTLFFFKYYNFFARGVALFANVIGGAKFNITFDIVLPIGISFYTFQALSYVADVYSGKTANEKNIFIYALYLSFYPQLIAGPIERSGDLIPQLKVEHVYNENDFIEGFKLMAIGFFEKIAVADILGVIVNATYENLSGASGLAVLIATLAFSAQILCDFKGYSDIAKGLARVYGIRLSDNFNAPYLAVSVRDFWRRWHITLSHWLRDYLYIPLGGSRVSFIRYAFNVLIVFVVSGLWHGAALNYLVWGVLHALVQIAEKGAEKLFRFKENKLKTALKTCVTFIIVTLLWVPFRSADIYAALSAYAKLFTDWAFTGAYFSATATFLSLTPSFAVAAAIILALYFSYARILKASTRLYQRGGAAKNVGVALKYLTYSALIAVTAASFIYLKSVDISSSFIYFAF